MSDRAPTPAATTTTCDGLGDAAASPPGSTSPANNAHATRLSKGATGHREPKQQRQRTCPSPKPSPQSLLPSAATLCASSSGRSDTGSKKKKQQFARSASSSAATVTHWRSPRLPILLAVSKRAAASSFSISSHNDTPSPPAVREERGNSNVAVAPVPSVARPRGEGPAALSQPTLRMGNRVMNSQRLKATDITAAAAAAARSTPDVSLSANRRTGGALGKKEMTSRPSPPRLPHSPLRPYSLHTEGHDNSTSTTAAKSNGSCPTAAAGSYGATEKLAHQPTGSRVSSPARNGAYTISSSPPRPTPTVIPGAGNGIAHVTGNESPSNVAMHRRLHSAAAAPPPAVGRATLLSPPYGLVPSTSHRFARRAGAPTPRARSSVGIETGRRTLQSSQEGKEEERDTATGEAPPGTNGGLPTVSRSSAIVTDVTAPSAPALATPLPEPVRSFLSPAPPSESRGDVTAAAASISSNLLSSAQVKSPYSPQLAPVPSDTATPASVPHDLLLSGQNKNCDLNDAQTPSAAVCPATTQQQRVTVHAMTQSTISLPVPRTPSIASLMETASPLQQQVTFSPLHASASSVSALSSSLSTTFLAAPREVPSLAASRMNLSISQRSQDAVIGQGSVNNATTVSSSPAQRRPPRPVRAGRLRFNPQSYRLPAKLLSQSAVTSATSASPIVAEVDVPVPSGVHCGSRAGQRDVSAATRKKENGSVSKTVNASTSSTSLKQLAPVLGMEVLGSSSSNMEVSLHLPGRSPSPPPQRLPQRIGLSNCPQEEVCIGACTVTAETGIGVRASLASTVEVTENPMSPSLHITLTLPAQATRQDLGGAIAETVLDTVCSASPHSPPALESSELGSGTVKVVAKADGQDGKQRRTECLAMAAEVPPTCGKALLQAAQLVPPHSEERALHLLCLHRPPSPSFASCSLLSPPALRRTQPRVELQHALESGNVQEATARMSEEPLEAAAAAVVVRTPEAPVETPSSPFHRTHLIASAFDAASGAALTAVSNNLHSSGDVIVVAVEEIKKPQAMVEDVLAAAAVTSTGEGKEEAVPVAAVEVAHSVEPQQQEEDTVPEALRPEEEGKSTRSHVHRSHGSGAFLYSAIPSINGDRAKSRATPLTEPGELEKDEGVEQEKEKTTSFGTEESNRRLGDDVRVEEKHAVNRSQTNEAPAASSMHAPRSRKTSFTALSLDNAAANMESFPPTRGLTVTETSPTNTDTPPPPLPPSRTSVSQQSSRASVSGVLTFTDDSADAILRDTETLASRHTAAPFPLMQWSLPTLTVYGTRRKEASEGTARATVIVEATAAAVEGIIAAPGVAGASGQDKLSNSLPAAPPVHESHLAAMTAARAHAGNRRGIADSAASTNEHRRSDTAASGQSSSRVSLPSCLPSAELSGPSSGVSTSSSSLPSDGVAQQCPMHAASSTTPPPAASIPGKATRKPQRTQAETMKDSSSFAGSGTARRTRAAATSAQSPRGLRLNVPVASVCYEESALYSFLSSKQSDSGHAGASSSGGNNGNVTRAVRPRRSWTSSASSSSAATQVSIEAADRRSITARFTPTDPSGSHVLLTATLESQRPSFSSRVTRLTTMLAAQNTHGATSGLTELTSTTTANTSGTLRASSFRHISHTFGSGCEDAASVMASSQPAMSATMRWSTASAGSPMVLRAMGSDRGSMMQPSFGRCWGSGTGSSRPPLPSVQSVTAAAAQQPSLAQRRWHTTVRVPSREAVSAKKGEKEREGDEVAARLVSFGSPRPSWDSEPLLSAQVCGTPPPSTPLSASIPASSVSTKVTAEGAAVVVPYAAVAATLQAADTELLHILHAAEAEARDGKEGEEEATGEHRGKAVAAPSLRSPSEEEAAAAPAPCTASVTPGQRGGRRAVSLLTDASMEPAAPALPVLSPGAMEQLWRKTCTSFGLDADALLTAPSPSFSPRAPRWVAPSSSSAPSHLATAAATLSDSSEPPFRDFVFGSPRPLPSSRHYMDNRNEDADGGAYDGPELAYPRRSLTHLSLPSLVTLESSDDEELVPWHPCQHRRNSGSSGGGGGGGAAVTTAALGLMRDSNVSSAEETAARMRAEAMRRCGRQPSASRLLTGAAAPVLLNTRQQPSGSSDGGGGGSGSGRIHRHLSAPRASLLCPTRPAGMPISPAAALSPSFDLRSAFPPANHSTTDGAAAGAVTRPAATDSKGPRTGRPNIMLSLPSAAYLPDVDFSDSDESDLMGDSSNVAGGSGDARLSEQALRPAIRRGAGSASSNSNSGGVGGNGLIANQKLRQCRSDCSSPRAETPVQRRRSGEAPVSAGVEDLSASRAVTNTAVALCRPPSILRSANEAAILNAATVPAASGDGQRESAVEQRPGSAAGAVGVVSMRQLERPVSAISSPHPMACGKVSPSRCARLRLASITEPPYGRMSPAPVMPSVHASWSLKRNATPSLSDGPEASATAGKNVLDLHEPPTSSVNAEMVDQRQCTPPDRVTAATTAAEQQAQASEIGVLDAICSSPSPPHAHVLARRTAIRNISSDYHPLSLQHLGVRRATPLLIPHVARSGQTLRSSSNGSCQGMDNSTHTHTRTMSQNNSNGSSSAAASATVVLTMTDRADAGGTAGESSGAAPGSRRRQLPTPPPAAASLSGSIRVTVPGTRTPSSPSSSSSDVLHLSSLPVLQSLSPGSGLPSPYGAAYAPAAELPCVPSLTVCAAEADKETVGDSVSSAHEQQRPSAEVAENGGAEAGAAASSSAIVTPAATPGILIPAEQRRHNHGSACSSKNSSRSRSHGPASYLGSARLPSPVCAMQLTTLPLIPSPGQSSVIAQNDVPCVVVSDLSENGGNKGPSAPGVSKLAGEEEQEEEERADLVETVRYREEDAQTHVSALVLSPHVRQNQDRNVPEQPQRTPHLRPQRHNAPPLLFPDGAPSPSPGNAKPAAEAAPSSANVSFHLSARIGSHSSRSSAQSSRCSRSGSVVNDSRKLPNTVHHSYSAGGTTTTRGAGMAVQLAWGRPVSPGSLPREVARDAEVHSHASSAISSTSPSPLYLHVQQASDQSLTPCRNESSLPSSTTTGAGTAGMSHGSHLVSPVMHVTRRRSRHTSPAAAAAGGGGVSPVHGHYRVSAATSVCSAVPSCSKLLLDGDRGHTDAVGSPVGCLDMGSAAAAGTPGSVAADGTELEGEGVPVTSSPATGPLHRRAAARVSGGAVFPSSRGRGFEWAGPMMGSAMTVESGSVLSSPCVSDIS